MLMLLISLNNYFSFNFSYFQLFHKHNIRFDNMLDTSELDKVAIYNRHKHDTIPFFLHMMICFKNMLQGMVLSHMS